MNQDDKPILSGFFCKRKRRLESVKTGKMNRGRLFVD